MNIKDHEIEWQKQVEALSGAAKVRAWQQRLRAGLPALIGDLPERKPAVPPAQVMGRVERSDCVIEKIIFESQPRFYVTANLYLPHDMPVKCPAILFTCGHSYNGKAYDQYHACCLGLVQKGYVVLIYDPVGQGERSQFIQGRNVWKVAATVSQHHAIARPSFLLGRTLLHFRIWDGIRALDYLLSRSEVDPGRIGILGNSGGGIMAQYLAALDGRIRVCASCSGGGSCESIFLTGVGHPERRIISLLPPRPLLLLWGEEERKGVAIKDLIPRYLRPLYTKLGVDPATHVRAVRAQGVQDSSTHSIERPHREFVYAWFNQWLENELKGKTENRIQPETEKHLLCTTSGQVLLDFPKSESTHTLNLKYLKQIAVHRRRPRSKSEAKSEQVNIRAVVKDTLGINIEQPAHRHSPKGGVKEKVYLDKYRIEKVVLTSNDGVTLRALLYLPRKTNHTMPVIFASEFGASFAMPLQLVQSGIPVFSLDVRHKGCYPRRASSQEMNYHPGLYTLDQIRINAAGAGHPLIGQQTGDILCAIDWLVTRREFMGGKTVVIGEGISGLWAMLAAAFDPRVAAAVAWKTLVSLRLLVEEQYHAYSQIHSYYYLQPGILRKLDIPDLACLTAPKPCLFLDPITANATVLKKPVPEDEWKRVVAVYRLLGAPGRFAFARSSGNRRRTQLLCEFLHGCRS